jgi:hypothetical protein
MKNSRLDYNVSCCDSGFSSIQVRTLYIILNAFLAVILKSEERQFVSLNECQNSHALKHVECGPIPQVRSKTIYP